MNHSLRDRYAHRRGDHARGEERQAPEEPGDAGCRRQRVCRRRLQERLGRTPRVQIPPPPPADKDKRRCCTRQDRVSSLIPIQSQLDSEAGPFSAHRKPFSRLAMSLRIGAITCA